MYLITNRRLDEDARHFDIFGDRPNPQGPNELRIVSLRRWGRGRRIQTVPDVLDRQEAQDLCREFELAFDSDTTYHGSLRVACDIVREARMQRKHVLLFVHGYNNDIRDVIERSLDLEKRYGTIVVPFSWPANGGGAISGTLSYKSDKRDARASAGALERTLMKAAEYLHSLTAAVRRRAMRDAEAEHRRNFERRDQAYSARLQKECSFTVNALFHSMGNYLLEQVLKSSDSEGNRLLFDNVVLCAADTNNEGHADWVDRLQFRNRLFVTINENDHALRASRLKSGSDQRARLGHYLRNLGARNAHYVNFTKAPRVGDSHGYFDARSAANPRVRRFFQAAFSGRPAEAGLLYRSSGNYFEFPG